MTDPLQDDLAHIRSLMERSTRFLSLSGLSGVFAGVVALGGAWLANNYVHAFTGPDRDPLTYSPLRGDQSYLELVTVLVVLGIAVLFFALIGAFWFTWRRSKRLGQGLWDPTARRLLWNMSIPLAAGGLFCLALYSYGLPGLVAPATLIFYGLALVNASKYTLDEIRWLGLSELVLGLASLWCPGAGLLFWALGFGVLHILYGGVMWNRHERGGNTAGNA
ncbi:MAG: hypothetical protein QM724_06525 [Flavobacteriales bacterium]